MTHGGITQNILWLTDYYQCVMMNPVEGGRIDCPLLRYYGVNAKLDAVLSQLTIEEF